MIGRYIFGLIMGAASVAVLFFFNQNRKPVAVCGCVVGVAGSFGSGRLVL